MGSSFSLFPPAIAAVSRRLSLSSFQMLENKGINALNALVVRFSTQCQIKTYSLQETAAIVFKKKNFR
jgi:hypothetical protein